MDLWSCLCFWSFGFVLVLFVFCVFQLKTVVNLTFQPYELFFYIVSTKELLFCFDDFILRLWSRIRAYIWKLKFWKTVIRKRVFILSKYEHHRKKYNNFRLLQNIFFFWIIQDWSGVIQTVIRPDKKIILLSVFLMQNQNKNQNACAVCLLLENNCSSRILF